MPRLLAGRPPLGALRAALLLSVALACGGDTSSAPTNTPGTTLVGSPSQLQFTESALTTTLYLSTSPSGGRLEYQVTSKPSWVTLESDHGMVLGITPLKVTAVVPETAEPGSLGGRLEMIAAGGTLEVPLVLTIAANPKLAANATTLTVPATADTGTLTLSNPGRGYTNWSLSGLPAWLTATPTSGYIQTGQSMTVKFAPDRQPLPAGLSNVPVTFKNEQTGVTFVVTVAVDVAAAPRASLRTSRLVFSASTTSAALWLVNPGKGPLAWNVSNKDAWLTVSPGSGTLAAGDSVSIAVNAVGAQTGSQGGFTIASNAVDAPSLRVAATVIGALPSTGLSVLPYRVVDAEFNDATGVLVTVSDNPSTLHVHDMQTGDVWSVPLSKPPCCVAIRRDGRYAVVAHDALISYVDLVSRQVVNTFPTTSDAFDVLLPDNGSAYVFPRTDQWVDIHAIDLQTGAELKGGQIFAGEHARLHPSGTTAYGIWALSPADLQKYELLSGKAPTTLRDSPYHGDYPMGYDLWISQDGTRIFTAAGSVFRSSSVFANDMLYAGKMTGLGQARAIADNAPKSRIYAFGTTTSPYYWGIPDTDRSGDIQSFDSSTLNALGVTTLPKIPSGAVQADADGWFMFPSADGQRLYMLLRAVPSAGLQNDWALYVVDTSTLP